MLTLSQPGNTEFGMRPPHDYSPPSLYSRPHYQHHSPKSSFDRPNSALPASNQFAMSTSHRGLPPPSAMNLPDPIRPPPPSQPPPSLSNQHALSNQQPLGPMPAPPNQWQGAEDSMRNWLSTKAEEERRKQEEARARQEELKLEQRRVEQSMLRESMQGGVPPQMIPIIFAGIGGSAMAQVSIDWVREYAQQQMQALDVSADSRREPRMINPPQPPYAAAPGAQVQAPPPLTHHQTTFPAFPQDGRSAQAGPTSAPRSAMSGLSRLNTVDLPQQQQQAAAAAAGPGSAHPRQTEPQNSSPSIYFHHWVPPQQHESKSSNQQPPTPSGRNDPGSAHPSHLEGDYKDSPRKRKATGAHQPPPAPSQTSPSFGHQKDTRRQMQGSHSRSRSQKSNEGHPIDRPPTGRKDSVAAPRTSHESLSLIHISEPTRPY